MKKYTIILTFLLNRKLPILRSEVCKSKLPMRRILTTLFLFAIILGSSVWTQAATLESATVSPFTGSTYKHNTKFANTTLLHGIDVSKYDATIDWKKVKAAGVDYALVRVGYRGYGTAGNLAADPYYAINMKNAFEAGVRLGVYIYSQAITVAEAEEEAQYVLDRLSGYLITMPIVMDVEYADGPTGRLYNAKLSKDQATEICLAFIKKIKAAGYTPMVYANKTMLTNGLNAETIAANAKIWLANYTTQTTYTGTYEFWQYTEKGAVDGITGNVDCNFWYQGADKIPTVGTVTVPVVSGVKKTAATTNALTLSWNTVANATGYEIVRSRAADGTYKKVATVTTPSYKNTALLEGTAYYYQVRAYRSVDGKTYYGAYSPVTECITTNWGTRQIYAKKKTYVRKTAKASAAKVVTLPAKKYAAVLATTKDAAGNKWYKVTYKKSGKTYTGYVVKTNTKLYAYAKAKTKVILRRKKSAKSNAVITIKKNQKVTILSKTTTWTKVSYLKKGKVYRGFMLTKKLK